jgi:hypothetical protein
MLAIALAGGAVLAACSPFPSKGTVPPPGPNGQVDASSAPDFLAVAGRDAGIAGYARKEDVLGSGDAPFPVYGDDLRTILGRMVPGKGFIAAGVDPNTVPNIPVVVAPSGQGQPDGSKVVLYVKNDSRTEINDAVLVGGQVTNGGGFWGQNMGVSCYSMPVGSRLVLLDRSATEPGAIVLREVYVRGAEPKGPLGGGSLAPGGVDRTHRRGPSSGHRLPWEDLRMPSRVPTASGRPSGRAASRPARPARPANPAGPPPRPIPAPLHVWLPRARARRHAPLTAPRDSSA